MSQLCTNPVGPRRNPKSIQSISNMNLYYTNIGSEDNVKVTNMNVISQNNWTEVQILRYRD